MKTTTSLDRELTRTYRRLEWARENRIQRLPFWFSTLADMQAARDCLECRGKKRRRPTLRLVSVIFSGWLFLNTWPGSSATTVISPFRSLSQCALFRGLQQKLKAKVSTCLQDGETPQPGWTTIVNGGSTLSLTAGVFPDQATCEAWRADLQGIGEDTASACWPH